MCSHFNTFNENSIMISILNNVAGKCWNMLFCEWLTGMIITDSNVGVKAVNNIAATLFLLIIIIRLAL